MHGADNSNVIDPKRLVIFPRTEGVSSTELRERVIRAVQSMEKIGKHNSATDALDDLKKTLQHGASMQNLIS